MFSLANLGNDLYYGKKSVDFISRSKLWYILALAAVLVAILMLIVRGGFNLSIEFKGGSSFHISNVQDLNTDLGADAVHEVEPTLSVSVSRIGSNNIQVQTSELSDTEVIQVSERLAKAYNVAVSEVTSSYVGPTWGSDISKQAFFGLIIFLVLVSLVMFAYFKTWRMSAAALIALFHDLIVTVGLYAAIGFQVSPASVIGFLTILGYSLYDTVVVFDKVRENTVEFTVQTKRTFSEIVNLSLNQTLMRSINTSVVAILPVGSILFIGAFMLGAGTLIDISLALFIGMIVGTYSTIFLATPMYATLSARDPKIVAHTKKVLLSRKK